jgi:hypothetical protein
LEEGLLRFVRQLFCASLIAYHAAVSLCAPCLHELAGSSHVFGGTPKPHNADDSSGARGDSKSSDLCLICQFVAQSQLPVELGSDQVVEAVAEIAIAVFVPRHAVFASLAPSPRAPPIAGTIMS